MRMAQYDDGILPAPEFQHTEIKEVESVVGQMVLLPCTVKNLGDRVVSINSYYYSKKWYYHTKGVACEIKAKFLLHLQCT